MPISHTPIQLPPLFEHWFNGRGWQLRPYQAALIEAFDAKRSTLLIAPTGAGKTLSGFLPALIDIHQKSSEESADIGLHTLYLSPLKALAYDIQRNLTDPIEQMNLQVRVGARTGDTSGSERQKQRRKPPNILLTTPESLMLMLSYADADKLFGKIKLVIIDEAHSFAFTKRGDFTALALARLQQLSPNLVRVGLSATVARPSALASWLGHDGEALHIETVSTQVKPHLSLMASEQNIPFAGNMGKYAASDILQAIDRHQRSLVFVNTRGQAELLFQALWEINKTALPIAIYHSALSKEQRQKTADLMAQGRIRSVVTTSALELGIDWGDVDLVIQVGAPKGVSRLLQRIGRANHRLDEPSNALLVPANRFEALECVAAMHAISINELDGDPIFAGALDIIPQFIVNCLCHQADTPASIFALVTCAAPYAALDMDTFMKLWAFTLNGGYALQAYERYNRLVELADGKFAPANKRVIMRHRQNIGTIVEAGRLKVKRLRRAHQGKIIGEVEEYFAQQLVPGDTFFFAGEILAFEGIKDMMVEARPSKAKAPKIPSFVGGQMPLSTYLAEQVRSLLQAPERWHQLPEQVSEWLQLQTQFSLIPSANKLLIESFPFRRAYCVMLFTFEGRKANQTLGMLLSKRMEKLQLKPLSFSISDYGLSISSLIQVAAKDIPALFNPDILGDELENWMFDAPMLKRSFRRVAMVSGLTEQRYHSAQKSMKQVTFSTDLIYDTLREHDPDHILLQVTREDAERELLDLKRTADLLIRFHQAYDFMRLDKPSPMAIPIVLDARSEAIQGAGQQALLEQASLYHEAESMLEEVRALLCSQ